MNKEFCHYSPRGTSSDDLTECECHFFRTDRIFNGLFRGSDGRFWCALHAPLDSKAVGPQPNNATHDMLALVAVGQAKQRGETKIDFRKTSWPVTFDDNWFRKHFVTTEFEFDFSGAVFAKGGTWHHSSKALVCRSARFKGLVRFHSIFGILKLDHADIDGDLVIDQASNDASISQARVSGNISVHQITGSCTLTLDGCQANAIVIGLSTNQNPIKLNASKLIIQKELRIRSFAGDGTSQFNCVIDSLQAHGLVTLTGNFLSLSIRDSLVRECSIEAKFDGAVDFESTVFKGCARFRDSRFGGIANFIDVTFSDEVDFRNAIFKGHTLFSKASFEGKAAFKNVAFQHFLDFSGAVFEDHVTFHPSESSKRKVKFDREIERGTFRTAIFNGTRFKSWVDFKNRQFDGPLSFKNAWFSKAPNFHGCKFHQDTSFRGAQFFDVVSDGAAEAYRTLKLAMETARAKDEEARFYSLEQRSWRKQAKGSPILRAVSWLYDFGSDYGRSIGKPCGLTLMIAAVFCFAYWGALSSEFSRSIEFCVSQPPSGPRISSWEISIRHMFTQIVRPFEALTLRAGGYGSGGGSACTIPGWLAAISTAQTLLHLGSIALVFLAIRRRFKMD